MGLEAFALADVGFVLEREAGAPPLPLPEAYRPFITASCSNPRGRFLLTPFETGLPHSSPGTVTWTCETWRLGMSDEGDWVIEIHSVLEDRWIAVAQISPDFARARLRPIAGRQGRRATCAMNYPSDQAILTNRLLHFDAGVIHACGIVHTGRGYVFCGRSGVGKTTVARLWRQAGAAVLNDDRVILRNRRGIQVASSPWHGEDRAMTAEMVPLGGIFHLVQGRENRLQSVTGVHAAAQLVATSLAPFYSPEGIERLLALVSTVIDRVPSYRLEFTPDQRAIAVCADAIAAGV